MQDKNINTFSRSVADSLRGVMQLGIVMSHMHYAVGGILLPMMIANRLGTSFIALYFFISGYGLMASLLRSDTPERAWHGFLPRRLWGLMRPPLIITVIALLTIPAISMPSLGEMLWEGTTPIPNAWFVFVLAFLYSAFWLSFRFAAPRHSAWGFVWLLALSLLSMAWAYVLGYERAWWVTTLGFWAGSVYARWEEQIYTVISKWWGLLIALGLVAGIIRLGIEELLPLTYLVIPIAIVRLLALTRYTAWIDSGRPARWMPQWLDRGLRAVLGFLSLISYELYLVHGLMIILLHGLFASPVVYSLAVIASSIAVAYLAHRLIKLFP